MHESTANWMASVAMERIRAREDLTEHVAYELGGRPFIDHLRVLVTSGDKPLLRELIWHRSWWMRYLGTNMSRSILDRDLATDIHARFRAPETHFHTRVAQVFRLLHAGSKGVFAASTDDVDDWLKALEREPHKLLACIDQFYAPGNPLGTWESVRERWNNDSFVGSRAMYLVAFALLAEAMRPGIEPTGLDEIVASRDPLLSERAARVLASLRSRPDTIGKAGETS